jgi:hypothetical protein
MRWLHGKKSNVYVKAMSGEEDAEAWTSAEAALAGTLSVLRADALAATDSRDRGAGSAIDTLLRRDTTFTGPAAADASHSIFTGRLE